MILFEEDWYKKHPGAIVDTKTKNVSWLRIAGLYKRMGIKNHAFMLALHDSTLQGIDPFDPELTQDQKLRIARECKVNPWYWFREVMTVPAKASNKRIQFRANRANIATLWLAFNHITGYLIQPRQTGKSLTGDGLDAYMLNTGAANSDLSLITKDEKLRIKTSLQVRELITLTPKYLQLLSKKDIKNNERVTINALGNSLNLYVGRNDKKAADNLGRGMTTPIIRIDEFAYIYNIDITLPTLLASSTAAREEAAEAGSHYYTLFTTTPGKLNIKEGIFAHDVYQKSVRWSEKFLDQPNIESLKNLINKNSLGYDVVLLEFNHRQLGFTDEWLIERVKAALSSGENAESDFFMKWIAGTLSSPVPKNILNIIVRSRIIEPNVEIAKGGYIINWFVNNHELNNLKVNGFLSIGLDTSDALGGKNDDIALVIRNTLTGAVVGGGRYNETNLAAFADFLVWLLEEYPNSILIPERRSSATAIMDFMFRIMIAKKMNPFKRIYNLIVQNLEVNQQYKKETLDRMPTLETLSKHKRKFGYATSSKGEHSREFLYGNIFKIALSYTADTVRYGPLISQIASLKIKNNRIDHGEDEHDDLVFSWLLAMFFIIMGKNTEYYGMKFNHKLNIIVDSEVGDGVENKEKVQEQLRLKNTMTDLIEKLKATKNEIMATKLINKIRKLETKIDTSILTNVNIDSILDGIKIAKRVMKRK